MSTILFTHDAEGRIRAHGARAYPDECCGALLGRSEAGEKIVLEAWPVENARSTDRERRFLVDDETYLRVEREADRRGMTLLGFYHTHPDHPAAPSATDLASAFPWFSTVILAVRAGVPAAMTSWVLAEEGDRFLEECIERRASSAATPPNAPESSPGVD